MTLRRLGLTAVAAVAVPASLLAQPGRPMGSLSSSNRAPDKDAAQVMITSFKASPAEYALKEKGLGYRAAEEMRKRVDGAFPTKQIWVVPIERINPQLEASNFSTTEGLASHDARQLAVFIRADEYIAGVATKTATGFRIDGELVLTRDVNARQPLGFGEAPKLGDAVDIVVKEYKEARKQLDGEKKCVNAARDQKWPEAIQFANAAITAYPKSTLARTCLMNVLYSSKAPTEEVTKVAKALSEFDPHNNAPLKFILDAYDKAGPSMSDSLVATLTKMMRNDPQNTELQRDAIKRIAAASSPAVARPIIDSAIAQNGGDPELMQLRWLILYNMKDYKAMYAAGSEMIRMDAALADSTYYVRTAGAYSADSAFGKAAETMAQATLKFPKNGFMAAFQVQYLQQAGQFQQALDRLHAAKAAGVEVPNAGAVELLILQQMKAPSAQIVAVAKGLIAAGDTTSNVRQLVLNEIQTLYSLASGPMMQSDAAGAIDSLNVALVSLKEAETSLAKTALQKGQVAYLAGAANLAIGRIKSQQAAATKNCQLAKDARTNVTAAMTYLPGGVPFAQAAVTQSFQLATQVDTYLTQLMASFPNCR